MSLLKTMLLIAGILVSAILFGFFFTLSYSIMPGLDQTDPYAALLANQEIGRATKQSYFFVALLGTPLLLLVCLLLSAVVPRLRAGIIWLVVALVAYGVMLIVTTTLNVPLNNFLDGLTLTPDQAGLAEQWSQYSVDWQRWNFWRFVASGITVLAVTLALVAHIACPMSNDSGADGK